MPLFCDIALARRIELAEARMLTDACANVRRRLPDLHCAGIAGGVAVITEPGSPLNKVAGLGFEPVDEAEWTALEQQHARRAAAVQVELCTLADPAIGAFLTARGYRLVGVENVCGRALGTGAPPLPPAPPASAGITIERCGADALATWVDVSFTGFLAADAQGVPTHEPLDASNRDVIARVIADFAGAAGVTLFFARRDGATAGAAAMRLCDGVAQLAGASTLPGHRRRGVQSALLAHRLAHAAAAGCDLAVVTTQPGSKSQANMHRAGFELLYARSVLVRAPG
jgi:GNAT superfamily N-acetyltransferase